MRRPIYSLLTLLLASITQLSGGTNRFNAEIISRNEVSTNLSHALWHPSGQQVTYVRPRGEAKHSTNVLWSYDLATGNEAVLFEPPAGTNQPHLSLSSYQWSPHGDAILVSGDQDLWLVPLPGAQPRRLTHDKGAEELATFSPDGRRVAFVRSNNLFVVELKTGRETPLTSDGSDLIWNGRLDWVYGEEFSHCVSSDRAYEWSADGRYLVFLRLDDGPVPDYPITDFLRTHPTVSRQRYPKAGDTNPLPAVFCVDVTRAKPHLRAVPLGTNVEYVLPEFSWTPDSKSVAVMSLNRGQNELSVRCWSPASPQATPMLLHETDAAWLNVFDPPRFLTPASLTRNSNSKAAKNDAPFLWLSERDGWLHAYLFNPDGTPRHQITRGSWHIEPSFSLAWSGRPVEIDPDQQWIYFSATEADPRERQLYRARLDGSAPERLTREPGTHFQKLSPDGRHLLEIFSSVDRPPSVRVLRNNGTVVATLDQRADHWKDFAGASSEFHEVTASDGAKLFGQLTKPADFDPTKKYPVIVQVYGGPQAQLVRNHWPAANSRSQWLAQEGFLIWSLDNRGSWGRGHAWETTPFKNLGAKELSDQLAGVLHLKTLPFVDTNRFGIFGWSYGGYMTLYALTHAPEIFRCGVAGAPVTDWKYYDTIYTERYMRTPRENPAGYKTSSPLTAAGQLKAKVLLIHGTADDNVHLQNTLNFIDALTKAGRPYELQIQPGQRHGFGGEAANQFLAEQLIDFFRRNL